MPKIFPIVVRKIIQQGGGNVPAGAAVLTDAASFKLATSEPLAAQSDVYAAAVRASQAEANTAQTEAATAAVSGGGIADTNAASAEATTFRVRYWATAAADNDQSRTTPANSTGANNGAVSTVRTNLATLDTTNPVVLTGSAFGVPSTGTYTQKLLRVFCNITAAPGSDTLRLIYNVGAGDVVFFTASAAANNLAAGLTFDVSALSLAQLGALTLKASYQAAVVISPSSSITVDAWCVELVRSF